MNPDSVSPTTNRQWLIAKVRRVLAVCLFISWGLTGCTPAAPPADLVIINGPELESLDPAIITAQADLRVAGALFEGLTRYDPRTAEPIPGLAKDWEISPDGRVYTFELQEAARWSTGRPITARDVVYSWRRVLDPSTAADYVGQLFYLQNAESYANGEITDFSRVGVEALSERRLRVTLEKPTPFFLDLCAFPTLAVVPRETIEKHGDRWIKARPLPTSGPYQLVTWRLNHKIRLRKNPHYWDADQVQSQIIDLIPCIVPTTALNLYETGQADIVWDKELVPPELIDLLRQRPDFHAFDYLGTYFLRINVTKEPFDDPRVRRALALAIDKNRIVQRITQAGEKPASHLVPPGLADYKSPSGLEHDPARARHLLAEAGYPDGNGFPRIEYMYNTGKTHEKIAVELQAMWREVLGIKVGLRNLEWKVFLNAQSELNYQISRSSWIGDYKDPNTFLNLFTRGNGNNRTGWANDRYDRMIRRANGYQDPQQRMALLAEAERLLVEEALPIIPLYIYKGLEYYDPEEIDGVYPNLRGEHPLWAIRKRND